MFIKTKKGMPILQDWVLEMGLRHQGVLLTAVRGCDTAPKNDASKDLQRCLRETFLVPFCTDSSKSVSFIEKVSDDELQRRMKEFTKSFDNYACHYVLHIVHAAEIIGWYHPDSLTASRWNTFYRTMCKKMHFNSEGKDQLDYRLGVNEETFGKNQNEHFAECEDEV